MAMDIGIRFTGGLHIKGSRLNLDAPSRTRTSVVTHSEVGFLRRKAKIVLTSPLLSVIGKRGYMVPFPLVFFAPMEIEGVGLELYPSGYSKGASMVLLNVNGQKVLYASRLGLDQQRTTAESPRVPDADFLVVAMSPIRFNQKNRGPVKAFKAVETQIERSLSRYNAAVILSPLPADALELALTMKGRGLRVLMHPSFYAYSRRIGVPGFHRVQVMPGKRTLPAVILWPDRNTNNLLDGYKGPVLYLPGASGDLQVPFSGMIDPWRVIKLAKQSNATKVFVVGALSEASTKVLTRSGLNFEVFTPPVQTEMSF